MRADLFGRVRFQGAMADQNVYKGTPSHDLDSAWENLLHSEYCLCLNGVTAPLDRQLIRAKKKGISLL